MLCFWTSKTIWLGEIATKWTPHIADVIFSHVLLQVCPQAENSAAYGTLLFPDWREPCICESPSPSWQRTSCPRTGRTQMVWFLDGPFLCVCVTRLPLWTKVFPHSMHLRSSCPSDIWWPFQVDPLVCNIVTVLTRYFSPNRLFMWALLTWLLISFLELAEKSQASHFSPLTLRCILFRWSS